MVNKFKKTAMRKQQTASQMEAALLVEKDVMEGKWLVKMSVGWPNSYLIAEVLSRPTSLLCRPTSFFTLPVHQKAVLESSNLQKRHD